MSDLVSQNLNMVFKTPKGETVHALKNVSFTLKKGELLTVLGPSGCGKTTLLNITAGFLRPTSGKITLNEKEIDGPGVERGMVFQQGALFEWLTVAENVNFGLRMKKEDAKVTSKKVDEWLDIVGLKGFGNTPTYQLSAVVDDHLLAITHIIRGEDHLSNTPKQILIYNALKWDAPEFAHLPMILGSDGNRLSKRHGAVGTQTYRELGYLPDTLINYLALLGWNPGTEEEVFNFQFLLDNFSLEKVNKKAAVFDNKKLDWLSGQHIMQKESEDLLDLIRSIKPEWGSSISSEKYLISIIMHLKERSKTLLDIITQSEYFFNDPGKYAQNAVAKCWYEDTPKLLKSLSEKS